MDDEEEPRQTLLWDEETLNRPPFVRRSETSEAGTADAIEPDAETLRGVVLKAIRLSVDGLTDEEIQERTGMNPSTQRPRRIELTRGGLVEDSHRTRATRSGRQAVIWQETKS